LLRKTKYYLYEVALDKETIILFHTFLFNYCILKGENKEKWENGIYKSLEPVQFPICSEF
jgi:hypothetical protein